MMHQLPGACLFTLGWLVAGQSILMHETAPAKDQLELNPVAAMAVGVGVSILMWCCEL